MLFSILNAASNTNCQRFHGYFPVMLAGRHTRCLKEKADRPRPVRPTPSARSEERAGAMRQGIVVFLSGFAQWILDGPASLSFSIPSQGLFSYGSPSVPEDGFS